MFSSIECADEDKLSTESDEIFDVNNDSDGVKVTMVNLYRYRLMSLNHQ